MITSAAQADGLQVQVIRDETELEAVRRARDSVLANISHEFRTPLAAQLASIELLLAGSTHMPREQQRELVTSLERGTLRLTRLIDNLLESVRIESGQLAHPPAERGARRGRRRTPARWSARCSRSARQTLEVSLPEELPRLSGDKTRLTQVFVNLLANANKFAPEDSVVRIGAAAQAGSECAPGWRTRARARPAADGSAAVRALPARRRASPSPPVSDSDCGW